MSDPNNRSSRLISAGTLPKLSPEEVVRRESENGLKQTDRMFAMIEHAIVTGKFRLRPSTLIELDRLAVAGLVGAPGALRTSPIEIEHSAHSPPPHEDVAAHVDDLCEFVTEQWSNASAVRLAAYVLWRLNWIHPFEDGNGRTSRAASYLVLCVRLGYKLPGTRTIPEFIAADKSPYYRALEAADNAWKGGLLDLAEMEQLLKECLAAQLVGVVQQAVGSSAEMSLKDASPIDTTGNVEMTGGARSIPMAAIPEDHARPRVFVGSSTEALRIAEALQLGLEYDAEVTAWHQAVFGLSGGTLDSLLERAKSFDFAVLVLAADDMLTKRGEEKPTARDNVLFELGVFIATLGRQRTFIVHPRGQDMHLPSDLAGVTTATYDHRRSDGNVQAALGAATTLIKNAIRDQGRRE